MHHLLHVCDIIIPYCSSIDSRSDLPCSAAIESGESPLLFLVFTLTPLQANRSNIAGSAPLTVQQAYVASISAVSPSDEVELMSAPRTK